MGVGVGAAPRGRPPVVGAGPCACPSGSPPRLPLRRADTGVCPCVSAKTGCLHQGAVRRGYFLAARPVLVAWPGHTLVKTDGTAILDREASTEGFT